MTDAHVGSRPPELVARTLGKELWWKPPGRGFVDARERLRQRVALFYTQLAHGCGDLQCSQASCRTVQERVARRPFRPLSHASAHAAALLLAAHHDPERLLCRRLVQQHLVDGQALSTRVPHPTTARLQPQSQDMDASSFMQRVFGTRAMQAFLYPSNGRQPPSPLRAYEWQARLRRITLRNIQAVADILAISDPTDMDNPNVRCLCQIVSTTAVETWADPVSLLASFRGTPPPAHWVPFDRNADAPGFQQSLLLGQMWRESRMHHGAPDDADPLSHLAPVQVYICLQWLIEFRADAVLLSLATGLEHLFDLVRAGQLHAVLGQDLRRELDLPDGDPLPEPALLVAHAVWIAMSALQVYVESKRLMQASVPPILLAKNVAREALDLLRLMAPWLAATDECHADPESKALHNRVHQVLRSHLESCELFNIQYKQGFFFKAGSDLKYRNPFSVVHPLLRLLGFLAEEQLGHNSHVRRDSVAYSALKAFETLAHSFWSPYGDSRAESTWDDEFASAQPVHYRDQPTFLMPAAMHAHLLNWQDLVDVWVQQPPGLVSLLEFPWLFHELPDAPPLLSLQRSFRYLCFQRMWKSFKGGLCHHKLIYNGFNGYNANRDGSSPVSSRARATTLHEAQNMIQRNQPFGFRMAVAPYLEIQVWRDSILDNAMTDLWGRERRHLLSPLRVKMMDVGEIAADMGGVAQEFFSMAAREMLDPAKAIFRLEGAKQCAYFNPASREPLARYHVLGAIAALAVHNGFTLPVNFPLLFYRKLLDPCYSFLTDRAPPSEGCDKRFRDDWLASRAIQEILDGWTDLAAGLHEMQSYRGSVEDDLSTDWSFAIEAQGRYLHVPLQRYLDRDEPFCLETALEAPPEQDFAAVTNENCAQYIAGYVHFLTDLAVRRQFDAFREGFNAILPPPILKILTPQALKLLLEGYPEVNAADLQQICRYETYTATSPAILDFWTIVGSYDQDKLCRLLEFVTASDRVPVNGLASMEFKIQKHGDSDDALPSSSTCFGILFLPEYSSRAIMEERLRVALEVGVGFGLR